MNYVWWFSPQQFHVGGITQERRYNVIHHSPLSEPDLFLVDYCVFDVGEIHRRGDIMFSTLVLPSLNRIL